MEVRVGFGVDLHRFSDDPHRPLVLGGITFEGKSGLVGHSDADAIAHACADALLGAANLGDLGSNFPDDSGLWRGADSMQMLGSVAAMVNAEGWTIGNIDCSIILDDPKLRPVAEDMAAALSEKVGAPVRITGRRTEGIGAMARGEGVVAMAVAIVTKS